MGTRSYNTIITFYYIQKLDFNINPTAGMGVGLILTINFVTLEILSGYFRDELWLTIIFHFPSIFFSTEVATPFRFISELSLATTMV